MEEKQVIKPLYIIGPLFLLLTGGLMYWALRGGGGEDSSGPVHSVPFGQDLAHKAALQQTPAAQARAQAMVPQAQTALPASRQPDSSLMVAKSSAGISGVASQPRQATSSMMVFYGDQPAAPSANAASGKDSAGQAAVQSTLAKWRKACADGTPVYAAAIKMLSAPPLLKAFLNDPAVVRLFLKRFRAQGLYSNPLTLISYVKRSEELNEILSSEAVSAALEKETVLGIICSSKLALALTGSPAMQAITARPSMARQFFKASPNMGSVLKSAKLAAAMRAVEVTVPLAECAAKYAVAAAPAQNIPKLQLQQQGNSSSGSGAQGGQPDAAQIQQLLKQVQGGQQNQKQDNRFKSSFGN